MQGSLRIIPKRSRDSPLTQIEQVCIEYQKAVIYYYFAWTFFWWYFQLFNSMVLFFILFPLL